MADNHDAEYVPAAMDYKAHEDTYKGFINLAKWTIAVLAVTMVLLYFIVRP